MDEKHKKIKNIIKKIGLIGIFIGATLGLTGIVGCIVSFQPTFFFCLFFGIPITMFSVVALTFGYHREVATYMMNENVPVINEASENVRPAVINVVSAVREGLEGNELTDCVCGEYNEINELYCSNCGRKLIKICPNCKNKQSQKDKYCNNCGTKL